MRARWWSTPLNRTTAASTQLYGSTAANTHAIHCFAAVEKEKWDFASAREFVDNPVPPPRHTDTTRRLDDSTRQPNFLALNPEVTTRLCIGTFVL